MRRLLVELLCEAANGNQEPCMMVRLTNIEDIAYMTRAFSKSEKSLSSSSSLLAALIAAIWRFASSSPSGISILYPVPAFSMDLPARGINWGSLKKLLEKGRKFQS